MEALTTVEEISAASGGYAVESRGEIYIPVVWVDEGERGEGRCSRFLDALPVGRTIKFPCVMNPQLRGMLERRGFRPETEWADEPFNEWVEVYVRRPTGTRRVADAPGGV